MCEKSTQIKDTDSYCVKLKNKNGFIEAGEDKHTLVNALIGINQINEYDAQLNKIQALAEMKNGPEIISDLSTIKPHNKTPLWSLIVKETSFVAATLPVYTVKTKNDCINANELLDIILEQMELGIGLITIHPTPTKELFELSQKRLTPITSRGGGIIVRDLIARGWKEENAYLKILPQIISKAKECGTVLSIGTSFRSANIFDSNDLAQKKELEMQIALAYKIKQENVGVIIETPGHAKPANIKNIAEILRKERFPIMPLGPVPTDIAIGMDHIAGAIGATLMGIEGCAHILAAMTREEHTGGNPTVESTIEAVTSARIAAHIIDIHRLNDTSEDYKIAKERASHHTCIIGKKDEGCNRCGVKCPLRK